MKLIHLILFVSILVGRIESRKYSNPWPSGSISVTEGENSKSIRIIPIPIFYNGNRTLGPYGYYGNGFYGYQEYSRDMYRDEEGFELCPVELLTNVTMDKLNQTIDEAIWSGEFDRIFYNLTKNPIQEPEEEFSEERPQLVDQIRSVITNYAFLCYEDPYEKYDWTWIIGPLVVLASVSLILYCMRPRKGKMKVSTREGDTGYQVVSQNPQTSN